MPILLAPLLLLLFCAAARAEGVLRVTTESSEYCEVLSARLAAAQGAGTGAGAVGRLAEDGRRLCQDGHVRAGIAKLRRALRAAQQGE
jgi:hypothetical protein